MSAREDYLEERLKRYLKRRTAPDRVKADKTAWADEVRSLCVALGKPGRAPMDMAHIPVWFDRLESWIDENVRGQLWPAAYTIKEAAEGLAAEDGAARSNVVAFPGREGRNFPQGVIEPEPARYARKVLAREAVPDTWLWGRLAQSMLDTRLVTIEDLEPYRDAIRAEWRASFGDHRAAELEEERRTGRYKAPEMPPSPLHAGGLRRMNVAAPRYKGAPAAEPEERTPHWTETADPQGDAMRTYRAEVEQRRLSMGLAPKLEPEPEDYNLVPEHYEDDPQAQGARR